MKIHLYTVFDFLIGFLIQSSKAFYWRDNNSIVQVYIKVRLAQGRDNSGEQL